MAVTQSKGVLACRCGLLGACLAAFGVHAQLMAVPPPSSNQPASAAAPPADWSRPDRMSVDWLAAHPNPFITADSVDAPLESRGWLNCAGMWQWAGRQCAGLKAAWYQGRATWYLSGYAWHLPGTWVEERLRELNQNAWGGGYGFARMNERGDNYSWYTLAFKDSHYNVTTMVGWGAITYWAAMADVSVGVGYTAFIMIRPDIAKGWPFPAALPLASVKVHDVEVLGTFIPKLSGGVNHGDVAFFFARYQF